VLQEGCLYFFTPFYFKNSTDFKHKFFIVLKNHDNKIILGSLPTSSNKAPTLTVKSHGCINIDERRFNCYVFENKRAVCDNGFSFDVPTYVYGDKINDYDINSLTKNGSIVLGKDYELKGKLTISEFKDLLECIISSNSTINKYKKLLKK
jgi:hypothetical protein